MGCGHQHHTPKSLSWVKCSDSHGAFLPCIYSTGIGPGFSVFTDSDMKILHSVYCIKNCTYWLRDADRPCSDYDCGK